MPYINNINSSLWLHLNDSLIQKLKFKTANLKCLKVIYMLLMQTTISTKDPYHLIMTAIYECFDIQIIWA